jgi:ubiquitin-protein ligase
MEEQLSIIPISGIRKRLKRELENFINDNLCTKEGINIKQNLENNYSTVRYFDIEIQNIKDNKHYCFTISNNYPFEPPKLIINYKPIGFYHMTNNNKFRFELKKNTGIECFCCETILCSYNWSPGLTLKNVINDIDKFRNAFRQVIDCIIVDVIKRKYFFDDVNIIEWLYISKN